MLSLTAHKAPRITANDFRKNSVVDGLTNENEATISPECGEIRTYERVAQKNPAFVLLVNTLDLEEVSSTVILQAITEEGSISNPTPVVKLTGLSLKEVAQRVFEPATGYTEAEAVQRLANLTAVTADRARNGINLMYAQRILSITSTNTYYLSESTPF